MIAQALQIMAEVHAGQYDKGGEHYVLHPVAVMGLLDLHGVNACYHDQLRCIALMHDVLEDCEPDDWRRIGNRIYGEFPSAVYTAVDALTHQRFEDYEDYIERISFNWMARRVKIADLRHNLDCTRMPERELTEKDFDRWKKYRRALVRLEREG